MKHLKTKFLIKEIAKDEGLTTQDVERIIDSHFEFVRHVMSDKVVREETYFPSIRLKYFGIFFCTEKKKYWMKKLNSKEKDKNESV